MLSEQETVDMEKQLRRIQSLYKRQMRVPLINSDFDTLLEEASEFFEEDIEAQMKESIKKTEQRLKDKIPFEDELVNDVNCFTDICIITFLRLACSIFFILYHLVFNNVPFFSYSQKMKLISWQCIGIILLPLGNQTTQLLFRVCMREQCWISALFQVR